MSFIHLHTHSEYSLLDGANRIPELVAHVKKLGMDSLAVTDHGNMHAAWSFYEEAKAQKIRPILGFEAYLAFGPRQAREKPPWAPAAYSHLVLLATNRTGYRNLVRLTSIGYHRGVLPPAPHRPGGAPAALRGPRLPGRLPLGRDRALPPAGQVRGGAGGAPSGSPASSARTGFWLEVQQPRDRRGARRHRGDARGSAGSSASASSPPTTRTTCRREDAESHDVLLAIGTGSDLDDPKRFRFTGAGIVRQVGKGNAGTLPGSSRRCSPTPRPSPTAASSTSRSAITSPAFPAPPSTRPTRRCSITWRSEGAARRYGTPLPDAVAERLGYELARDQHRRVRRLLPDRPGLHRGGAGARHSGGPGPRLGGGLARRLRARHHQRLPAQVRSPLRALPESRARVDARHRRRLLLRAARRGDRVRAGAVRPRRASGRSSRSAR